MEEHKDLHKIPQKQKDLLRKILLFSTALFFCAAVTIFLNPEETMSMTGLDAQIVDLLAPCLLIVALGDLIAALFVFHSRDRV